MTARWFRGTAADLVAAKVEGDERADRAEASTGMPAGSARTAA
ncbi:MAG: hypothetical protein U0869_22990 [Chloroflexota bacterium]